MSNILIPKKKVDKEQKTGFGAYWEKFWCGFDNVADYRIRIRDLKNSAQSIVDLPLAEDDKVYAEIKLIDEVRSKSNRPSELWKESNLDVVASRDEFTYKLAGKKSDFKKLREVMDSCSFEIAKEGGSRKRVKFSREVYAISSIQDVNTSNDIRMDRAIRELCDNVFNEKIDCIIEITQDRLRPEYNEIYQKLSQRLGSGKVFMLDEDFFVYNLLYGAELYVAEINSLLSEISFNFINKIKISPKFNLQRSISGVDLSEVVLGEVDTSQTVAVIDSGIKHPLIDKFVSLQYNSLLANQGIDNNHGTFVASRLLFGDNITGQISANRRLIPISKIIDSQILFGPNSNYKDATKITKAIENVANRHSDVFVYNLSINENKSIEEDDVSDLTAKVDEIAREKDILIVCSAGNNTCYPGNKYEEIFDDCNLSAIVASPGDALNVLTVGSIAADASADCYCGKGLPSPFTRRGGYGKSGYAEGIKKPELVESGGNIKIDPSGSYQRPFLTASSNSFGVEGIDMNGLSKDIGTSFSAPLIARQSALLYDYIINSNIPNVLDIRKNRVNLVKSLLIHSTSLREQTRITSDSVKKAYGFGIPDWSIPIQDDDENKVTFMYCDILENDNKKHKLNIELPQNLVGKNIGFIFTLVYNPPTNKNFPKNYNMIEVGASVRIMEPTIDENGEEGNKPDNVNPKNGQWNWENYKNQKFNVIHFQGQKMAVKTPFLQINISMNVYSEYEKQNLGSPGNIKQPYSFVLTIIDKEGSNNIRESIIQTGQFEVATEISLPIEVVSAEA
ncbi:MAG: S8 family peptidase [Patescibacteria group bacterium]|jgi:hypothetical protein